MKEEVVIIGGGLAGLTAAFRLKKHGITPLVLEAGDRLGGRIFTKTTGHHTFELGATWVFDDESLKQLVSELGLQLYPQYLKGDALIKYDPSMPIQRSPTDSLMNGAVYHKVNGGTGAIIQSLANQLDNSRLHLNSKVTALTYSDGEIALTLADGLEIVANKVIITIPPKAIAQQIQVIPEIDPDQLMDATHTWMGDSSKFTVLTDKDHWRPKNLSGFVFSNYGLIREMQDHSTEDGESCGLVGFIRPTGDMIHDFGMRKRLVGQELFELFGIKPDQILAYDDFLWGEHFVASESINYNSALMPHQNNGHPFYSTPHFDGHLFFAGAETSLSNPGYMEGAVRTANNAVNLLLKKYP